LIKASERIGEGDLSYRLEFKRVAHAFNTMAEKLERMLEGQRELLHLISHELRTPPTRINLALEMKNKKRSSEIIKHEIQDINMLIGEILDLSRLDQQGVEKIREKIDLGAVLGKIVHHYSGVRINFDKKLNQIFMYDHPVLIKNAFTNLIDNAVKYGGHDKPIILEVSQNNSTIMIAIKNDGKGTNKDEQVMVFKPFYRGSNDREMGAEGKGPGLTIVKRIIEMNSGIITINSSIEGLTIFTIAIPQYEEMSAQ